MNSKLLQVLFICFAFACISANELKSDEIRWLKLRQEIGLEQILNVIFAPGDTSILVTDGNFKLVELDASTGEVKRIIPKVPGAIKFSDDKRFLYTYGWEKVKWPSCEVIGKYPVPLSGFAKVYLYDYNAGFDINEKAGLFIGAIQQDDYHPWVWKKGIWVFDLNTFKFIDTLGFDKNYYRAVRITDDGKYFITDAGYVPDYTHPEYNRSKRNVWDTKTMEALPDDSPIGKIRYQLGGIKTSPDGKWLCSVGESLVEVFDNNTYEKKYEWRVAPDTSGILSAIDITSDSRYLATSGYGGSTSEGRELANVRIWDLTTGQLAYKYNNGDQGVDQGYLRFNYSGNSLIGYGPGAIIYYNNMVTSVPDNTDSGEPVLYPNPTTGDLTLKSAYFHPGPLKVELFDLNGKLLKNLFEGVYAQDDLRFDISFLSSGIYIVKANQNNTVKTFKVIKG